MTITVRYPEVYLYSSFHLLFVPLCRHNHFITGSTYTLPQVHVYLARFKFYPSAGLLRATYEYPSLRILISHSSEPKNINGIASSANFSRFWGDVEPEAFDIPLMILVRILF